MGYNTWLAKDKEPRDEKNREIKQILATVKKSKKSLKERFSKEQTDGDDERAKNGLREEAENLKREREIRMQDLKQWDQQEFRTIWKFGLEKLERLRNENEEVQEKMQTAIKKLSPEKK